MTKQCHNKSKLGKEERQVHYQAVDIQDKLIINLREINQVMRFLYEGKSSQNRILIILDEVESITQRELTKRLGIQPGSASEVIAKLEDAGHIVRVPSKMDRRTMDVVLTQMGKLQALESKEQRNRRHKEMFSCLSDSEKATLLSLLEKVNGDWKNRYQEAHTKEKHKHCEQSNKEYKCHDKEISLYERRK